MRDATNAGFTVQAPMVGETQSGLGVLYGFIAVEPFFGAGQYIVAFDSGIRNAAVHGGVGEAGPAPSGSQPNCLACGGNGPAESTVQMLSGNYVHQVTDLTLPARGIPVVFTRTYSAFLGWQWTYGQRVAANADGSLTYVDETGVPWRFVRDGAGARWLPPATLHQIIEQVGQQYLMTFKDGMAYRFNAAGKLLAERDLNGHEVTLAYVTGRLHTVTGVGGAEGMSRSLLKFAPDGGSLSDAYETCFSASRFRRRAARLATRTGRFL